MDVETLMDKASTVGKNAYHHAHIAFHHISKAHHDMKANEPGSDVKFHKKASKYHAHGAEHHNNKLHRR